MLSEFEYYGNVVAKTIFLIYNMLQWKNYQNGFTSNAGDERANRPKGRDAKPQA